MLIIFLGAPGAGKGTQAKLLQEKLNIPQISTGELFREEMKKQTELGKRITSIMESGNLVDDKTTINIFEKRIRQKDCEDGAILDGIPRTLNQARLLKELFTNLNIQLSVVLYIDLSEEESIDRLSGRWTCQKNGHTFHQKHNPPKVTGICDFDGSPLYQRSDQKPKVIQERLNVYKKNTEPLINFYKNEGKLITIDSSGPIEKVYQKVLKEINLTFLSLAL